GIMIRTRVEEISTMGRNTQGVQVINLKEGDAIADVTRVADTDDPEADDGDAEVSDDAPTNGEMDGATTDDAE
ncbi:MAG: DNA gyrase C-terminal beta-propeller domain-containing protein, partial [Salinibacter sp.]